MSQVKKYENKSFDNCIDLSLDEPIKVVKNRSKNIIKSVGFIDRSKKKYNKSKIIILDNDLVRSTDIINQFDYCRRNKCDYLNEICEIDLTQTSKVLQKSAKNSTFSNGCLGNTIDLLSEEEDD